MHWLKKHRARLLLPACYLLALVLFLVVQFAGFVQNRAAYANGGLSPESYSQADFDPAGDADIREGWLAVTGADPQLILQDGEKRVETLTVWYQSRRAPRAMQVFWAAPGQDYSLANSAFPAATGQQGELCWASFRLPATGGQSLRFDPDTEAGNLIRLEKAEVNRRRPFWQFFVPGAGEALLLMILPALAACGLRLLLDFWRGDGGGLLALGTGGLRGKGVATHAD